MLTEICARYMNCALNQRGGNQGTAGESSFSKEVIAQILSVTEILRQSQKYQLMQLLGCFRLLDCKFHTSIKVEAKTTDDQQLIDCP